MKKNILILVGLVVILGALMIVFKKDAQAPVGKLPSGNETETFSGTIEAVDTGCFADATCSVTVSGKKVILMTGMRIGEIPPVGKLLGVESIGDLEKQIGSHANVYATTTPEGDWTLYGDEKYYLEVTENSHEGK